MRRRKGCSKRKNPLPAGAKKGYLVYCERCDFEKHKDETKLQNGARVCKDCYDEEC